MKRRAFLAAAAVAPSVAAAFVAGAQGARIGKYGRVDVDRWAMLGLREAKARLLVNGVDVTDRCYLFDDSEGWADCYVKPYVVRVNELLHERISGIVEVRT